MGLKIYTEANPDCALSTGGSFINPLAMTFDGVNGGVIEKRLYLRNDESGHTYIHNIIEPTDTGSPSIIDGTNGYSWKLVAGDQRPLEEQWGLIDPAQSIELGDIEDTTTYLPFWIRIEIPAGAPIASFQTASLTITTTESI